MKSASLLKEETGDGQAQVYRYIRLTELIPELLDLVDEGRIAFRPVVELSYLQKEKQSALLQQISYADATPSLAQAIKLNRKFFDRLPLFQYNSFYAGVQARVSRSRQIHGPVSCAAG